MDEYISKERAKDLMGCCLASAKANYKAETSIKQDTAKIGSAKALFNI